MFGILRPLMSELRVREAEFYKALYCGVCRAIKLELGEVPRFALRYEAALMALIWLSLEGASVRAEKRLCAAKPFSPHAVIADHAALTHAGRICIVLAHAQCRDEARDGHPFLGTAARLALSPAAAKAARAMKPETLRVIEDSSRELVALEEGNADAPDAAADTSGRLLSAVFTDYPGVPEEKRETLAWMGYHLGRWLYLADAILDEEEDERQGQYNPILTSKKERAQARQDLRDSADFSAAQAAAAFDLLEFKTGRGILENLIYLGLPAAFRRNKKT